MPEKKFDVLVVGELNVDLILNGMEKFPEVGKEILASKMMLTLGSSSAIFASNLSVLGTRVSFCGCIGQDNFGEKILNDLSEKNVDTSYIIRSKLSETGITVALNVGEDRAMVTYPGAMNELKSADITDDMLLSARHLHVSSIFLQPALKPGLTDLFKRARGLGLTTSLDPQWDPAELWDVDWPALLPFVTVFLPNREELKNISSGESLEKASANFRSQVEYLVVKDGHDGAMLFTSSEQMQQAPFLNRDVVDAIGAGDSFNAGYIHSFVQGKPAKVCLEFGALCGAINTTESGGTLAFTNLDTVKRKASSLFKFQL